MLQPMEELPAALSPQGRTWTGIQLRLEEECGLDGQRGQGQASTRAAGERPPGQSRALGVGVGAAPWLPEGGGPGDRSCPGWGSTLLTN